MRELKRSALVPYPPAKMFALVDDIERYPEFLPWIASATVLEENSTERVGRLHFVRAGIKESVTSRNVAQAPERLAMHLIEGPFRTLEGEWTFEPLRQGAEVRGTRIGLTLRFELKSAVADFVLGKLIESSCDTVVDAFVKRAHALYG